MDKYLAVEQCPAHFGQNNPVCAGRQVGIAAQGGTIGGNRAKGIDIDNIGNIVSTELRLFRYVKIMQRVVDKSGERTTFVELNSVRQEKAVELAQPLADAGFAQALGEVVVGRHS